MSFLSNFLYNITVYPVLRFLKHINLFNKEANLVVLGLDNSGKTTLVGILVNNKIQVHNPTSHPNKENIKIGNVIFNTHDLGGHVAARRLWKQYLHNIDAIVFMIDSSDYIRIYEAKEELKKITSEINVPVLVLGNKIDKYGAFSENDLKILLGIDENNPLVKLFMCSIVKRVGIENAFNWLSEQL